MTPSQGQVVLGGGNTCLSIHGIGTVTCKVGENILTIEDVRHVPDLAESTDSLFWHIQSQSHSLQLSFEDGLHIIFPHWKTKALLGDSDIYLDMLPISIFSSTSHDGLKLHDTLDNSQHQTIYHTDSFCQNLKLFTDEVVSETHYLDNLLSNLRKYYKEIKTRRQLNLEVPEVFRQDSTLCHQIRDFHLYKQT